MPRNLKHQGGMKSASHLGTHCASLKISKGVGSNLSSDYSKNCYRINLFLRDCFSQLNNKREGKYGFRLNLKPILSIWKISYSHVPSRKVLSFV